MNDNQEQDNSIISIAGVLVSASPGRMDAVQHRLRALPGVEVHSATPEGKIVVTVEGREERMTAENVMRLYDVEGVLSAAIIYNYFEHDAAEQESSL